MDESAPDLLQTFLAGRDVACPGCGYNLRDLRGSRCPECGDALSLRVGLVEPKQAAGIAGLIGLAAGAGLSGLLLVYIVLRFLVFGNSFRGASMFVILNLGGLAVEGVALYFWLTRWQSIRRLPPGARVAWVAGCWMLTLANLLVFTWNIR